MRTLVIRQNFPGQLGRLTKTWACRPGRDARALDSEAAPGLPSFNQLLGHKLARKPLANLHPYLQKIEVATLHGQTAARVMLHLKKQGSVPDAIGAYPGSGETLYAKDVFPGARIIHLCEWYYNTTGANLNFDLEFPLTFDDWARIRTWNALHTLNFVNCNVGLYRRTGRRAASWNLLRQDRRAAQGCLHRQRGARFPAPRSLHRVG